MKFSHLMFCFLLMFCLINETINAQTSNNKSSVFTEEYALSCVKDYYEFYNANEYYTNPVVKRISNNVFHISVKYCSGGEDLCYTSKKIYSTSSPFNNGYANTRVESVEVVQNERFWYSKVLILTCKPNNLYTIKEVYY